MALDIQPLLRVGKFVAMSFLDVPPWGGCKYTNVPGSWVEM
jgi:hypothetical protein